MSRGNFSNWWGWGLGVENEQIFSWWMELSPIPPSRENPKLSSTLSYIMDHIFYFDWTSMNSSFYWSVLFKTKYWDNTNFCLNITESKSLLFVWIFGGRGIFNVIYVLYIQHFKKTHSELSQEDVNGLIIWVHFWKAAGYSYFGNYEENTRSGV